MRRASGRWVLGIMVLGLALWSPGSDALELGELPGWTPVDEVVHYGRDELWEYINGAAEQYISFGFQGLIHGEWQRDSLVVVLDIYDMGTPLGAYGIFVAQAPSRDTWVELGAAAAITPPYQCLLAQGRYYVRADMYEGEFSRENGARLLEMLAARLPGSNDLPPELALLPAQDQVPGTVGYARQDFLGLSELRDLVHATYRWGDEEFVLFCILADEGEEQGAVWARLEAKWTRLKGKKCRMLYREIPYRGLVGVARTETGLLGISGRVDEGQLKSRLAELCEAD